MEQSLELYNPHVLTVSDANGIFGAEAQYVSKQARKANSVRSGHVSPRQSNQRAETENASNYQDPSSLASPRMTQRSSNTQRMTNSPLSFNPYKANG